MFPKSNIKPQISQSKRNNQIGRNNRHGPKGAITSSLKIPRGVNVGGKTIFA
jgi:hypothetical protein